MQHNIQKQHLRKISGRGLVAASLMGAFFSFLFGAWIAPWVWAIILWVIHHIPWWSQTQSFPSLGAFFVHLNLLCGLIWLGYYAFAYLRAVLSNSGRQSAAWSALFERERRKEYGPWGYQASSFDADDLFHTTYESRQPQHPIAQAWPGELKYQLVEKCYDTYHKALQRFNPPPLTLETPPTFKYQKGGKLRWDTTDMIPILPEEYLTPERIHELLPWLAHAQGYYQMENLKLEDLEPSPIFIPGSPDYIPLAFLLIPTGNFLWLPVLVKRLQEEADLASDAARRREMVHKADAFAVLVGQGPPLEHQLRRMEEELKQRGEIDTSVPPLVERIGHLEVLNKQEREEMRKLGLTPKEPPLIDNTHTKRLNTKKNQEW